jgi:hypothetical protein
MGFFFWLIQKIKCLFTKELLMTIEETTIEATTYTLISVKPPTQEDPMECLESFVEVTLTV